MFLTISTQAGGGLDRADDLGFLLHKHPDKVHARDVAAGRVHVFYPVAGAQECTAAVLLEVDPVGLVRAALQQPRGQQLVLTLVMGVQQAQRVEEVAADQLGARDVAGRHGIDQLRRRGQGLAGSGPHGSLGTGAVEDFQRLGAFLRRPLRQVFKQALDALAAERCLEQRSDGDLADRGLVVSQHAPQEGLGLRRRGRLSERVGHAPCGPHPNGGQGRRQQGLGDTQR